MKTKIAAVCAVVVLLAAAGIARLHSEEVRSPWITTDRTVDCSSYETIIKGVIKPAMTEEQKAIAMFNFFLQRIYHYRNTRESRNPVKCVNVIGNTLCGSQATCMKGLLGAAGIKARVVSHPGHTFYEAFYDDKWHCFDTMMNFYVFTRGDKPHVASCAELNKDPSLITEAVKDERACPGICPCGDKPSRFAAKMGGVLNYKPLKSSWSVKDYTLRDGEEIVRSWWPHGRPVPGTYRSKDPGPLHGCGSNDRKNSPDLFKFWKPYGIPKYGKVSISYRHYYNGWMQFSPDLTAAPYKDGLTAGELVIPVKCPFYITGARVVFVGNCPGEGASIEVSAEVDGKWRTVMSASKTGTQEYRASLDSIVVRKGWGRHAYKLKFKLNGGAKLDTFFLKTIFTHNAMAAPHLMPGKNKVTLTAVNPEAAAETPVTVVYRYKDAPNWVDLKVVEKEIKQVPFTFQVDLPETDVLAQMQDLTIRCGKLAWIPEVKEKQGKLICDFSKEEAVKKWRADAEIKLSHDGQGMLMTVAKKTGYPQASQQNLSEDWREFSFIVIEMENLGPKPQMIVFRARSNKNNKERTDVQQMIPKGKFVMRIPVIGLTKTKIDNITKIYLMTLNVPEEGCKIRVTKIHLEPKKEI